MLPSPTSSKTTHSSDYTSVIDSTTPINETQATPSGTDSGFIADGQRTGYIRDVYGNDDGIFCIIIEFVEIVKSDEGVNIIKSPEPTKTLSFAPSSCSIKRWDMDENLYEIQIDDFIKYAKDSNGNLLVDVDSEDGWVISITETYIP